MPLCAGEKQARMAFTDTKFVGLGRDLGAAALCLALTLGCNNPGGAAGGNIASSSLGPTKDGAISMSQGGDVVAQIGYDSFLPDGSGGSAGSGGGGGTAGSGGSGGTGYPPDNAASVSCGDRVVGMNVAFGHVEECDDGDEGSDLCTAQCQ